jgi:hypothetical protein
MPGLVPGIHVLRRRKRKDVDGRVKPGHDSEESEGEIPWVTKQNPPAAGQTGG